MPESAKTKKISKAALDELISAPSLNVDLILEYKNCPETQKSYYHIYARYNKITRQIYTQRNSPRRFRDLERAIQWGKQMGFKSVSLHIDYELYVSNESMETL